MKRGWLIACWLGTMGCDAAKGLTGAKSEAGAGDAPAPTTASASTASGATVTTFIANEGAWGVAIDATHVYFSSMSGDAQGIRRKERSAAAGAPSASVCKVGDLMQTPQTLILDATNAYVITTSLGSGAVYRTPKNGTGAPCERILAGYGFLGNRGITKLGDTLFVAGTGKKGGVLLAIDAAGKSRVVIENPKPIDGLATDGKDLFFGSKESFTDVKLMKVSPSGGAATEIGKSGVALTFADGRLWYLGAGLQSVAPSGGATTPTGKPGGYAGFVLTSGRVYLGGQAGLSDGFVMRGEPKAAELAKHASFKGGVVTIDGDAKDVYVTTAQKELLRISP